MEDLYNSLTEDNVYKHGDETIGNISSLATNSQLELDMDFLT